MDDVKREAKRRHVELVILPTAEAGSRKRKSAQDGIRNQRLRNVPLSGVSADDGPADTW